MPPVRRPPQQREAWPQSDRCQYTEGRLRCRRIATVNGELCRHHAARLALELDRESPLDDLIAAVDRKLAQNPDPLVTVITGVFGRIIGRKPAPPPQPPRDPRARARPQPPRSQARQPPPPPPPDPLILARELLGFEPTEPLTIELVQKRKQALARVFHPDMPGGSENRMKRINHAADLLLSKL